jgi:hypothetical protein
MPLASLFPVLRHANNDRDPFRGFEGPLSIWCGESVLIVGSVRGSGLGMHFFGQCCEILAWPQP